MAPVIAILAGGQSRRMGADKAMLRCGDATLLERAAATALAVAPQRVLIIGRAPPPSWPAALSVRWALDQALEPAPSAARGEPAEPPAATLRSDSQVPPPFAVPSSAGGERSEAQSNRPGGPLSGLCTALHLSAAPVLALACDMPLLTPQALRWLLAQAGHAAAHGVVTTREGQPEPLFSLYLPACLPLAQERLRAGQRSLRGLIEAGDFYRVAAPPDIAACLANVNTPADLASLPGLR